MPRGIQQKRERGWRMPVGARSVARPGPWGNPFLVCNFGGAGRSFEDCETAEEAVRRFDALFEGSLDGVPQWIQERAWFLRRHIQDLRGLDLACWCPEDAEWCHRNVLLRRANEVHR